MYERLVQYSYVCDAQTDRVLWMNWFAPGFAFQARRRRQTITATTNHTLTHILPGNSACSHLACIFINPHCVYSGHIDLRTFSQVLCSFNDQQLLLGNFVVFILNYK